MINSADFNLRRWSLCERVLVILHSGVNDILIRHNTVDVAHHEKHMILNRSEVGRT